MHRPLRGRSSKVSRPSKSATIIRVKPVESLTVADLELAPVWQYTNRDGADETMVRAVKKIPVADVSGKLIGTQVQVAGSLPNYRLSKFQPLMPAWVEREVLGRFLLDVEGAMAGDGGGEP